MDRITKDLGPAILTLGHAGVDDTPKCKRKNGLWVNAGTDAFILAPSQVAGRDRPDSIGNAWASTFRDAINVLGDGRRKNRQETI